LQLYRVRVVASGILVNMHNEFAKLAITFGVVLSYFNARDKVFTRSYIIYSN
jgi:hypothetical protein